MAQKKPPFHLPKSKTGPRLTRRGKITKPLAYRTSNKGEAYSTINPRTLTRSVGLCRACPTRGEQELINGLCDFHRMFGVPKEPDEGELDDD